MTARLRLRKPVPQGRAFGIAPPAIREGTVGAQARALGAAAVPLSLRYLIDQNPVRDA